MTGQGRPWLEEIQTQRLHYKGVRMRWKFPAWTNFPHRTMADKCHANAISMNYGALPLQINGYLWAENAFWEARDKDGRHLMIFTTQNMERLHWLWIESDVVWQSSGSEGDGKRLWLKVLPWNVAKYNAKDLNSHGYKHRLEPTRQTTPFVSPGNRGFKIRLSFLGSS